jgi:hypothetical protein
MRTTTDSQTWGQVVRLFSAESLVGMAELRFDAEQLRRGAASRSAIGGFVVELGRADGDPDDVRRLVITGTDGFALELLPTKGLSVGYFNTPCGQVFWDIPVEALMSPEKIDLLGEMIIGGRRVKAMRWLENFAGCIELLGLSNWGMPHQRPGSLVLLPLHGEASQIPVDECWIRAGQVVLAARSRFIIRDSWWDASGDRQSPWYLRGRAQWQVTRNVVLDKSRRALQVLDEITNLGSSPAVPDWGYHVQLRAESGARLSIPSRARIDRAGKAVPEDFELWQPSPEPERRFERGYVHYGCPEETNPLGQPAVRGRAIYERGPNTLFTLPRSPYIQSWFSCGGSGGRAYSHPDRPDELFMVRGWNGMGPELGASPLDHNGAADPEIAEPALGPGESRLLFIEVRQE